MLHIALHFIVPALLVLACYRERWRSAYVILMLTMLVDLDHLLAVPIYDAGRCSIGFHPLHGLIPIVAYVGLTLWSKTRLVGIGLLIHMALDSIDCYQNTGAWISG